MPLIIKIAKKNNFVVKPNKRTSHEGEIPNVGGLNIFISFFLTTFLFCFTLFSELQFILLGVFIILIIGFVDDLIDLKVSWKLAGEFLSAFFLIVFAGIRITHLHHFLGIDVLPELTIGAFSVPVYSYLLSFFVFIVLINALNLIDGVDGLASGLGIIYCLFFGVYFMLIGNNNLSITSFAMVGSLTVFFIYNVFSKKNKIFMGDSGSLLLGYMITLYVFEFCERNAYHQVEPRYLIPAAPAFAACTDRNDFSLTAQPTGAIVPY